MRVKKAIKKLVALGAGASMVGATIFGAMAAAYDLSMYPVPFVKDGAFNAMIVVGEAAATNDVLGAIDIATNLQYAAKVVKEVDVGRSSGSQLSGNSYLVQKGSQHFEFNENITSVQTAVTKSDLTSLADGKVSNEFGDHTYKVTLYLPSTGRMLFTTDPDDTKSVAKPYFVIPNGQTAYRYHIDFSPALKSDHSTDGNKLEDIENKKIKIGEKEFTILQAQHTLANKITLKLMGGAVTTILDEEASKTFTIGGKDYDVTLDFVGSTTAKFTINDETTTSLQEADTFRLKDGIEIGVVDILAQQFAGGVRKVEFTLGANKIQITDNKANESNWTGTILVGSQSLSQVVADIVRGSDAGITHGDDVTIESIRFNYTAGDDLYVLEGGSVSTVADKEEGQKGNFLAEAFDFKFGGLQVPKTETIRLKPSSSTNYKLEWTNKAGVKYNSEIFGRNASTTFRLGRFSGSTMYDIVSNETEPITQNEYVVLTRNEYSRIYQFKDVNQADNIVKLKDVGSGDTTEITYSESTLQGSFTVDGNTYTINVSADTGSANLFVDQNNDADLLDAFNPEMWTELGLRMTLQTYVGLGDTFNASNENQINFTTEELEETSRTPTRDVWIVNITENGDGDIDLVNAMQSISSGRYVFGSSLLQSEDNSNKYQGYSGYGVWMEMDRKGSGTNTQNDFTVIYPDTEVFGSFFATTTPTAELTKTAAGKVLSTTVTRIDVGAAVLDTDPAVAGQETKKNLIVVGGPAANRAAAVLLGKPFPSYGADSGIPENAALVKLVEQTDGKVALIVAGWNAEDTQRASRVVAQYDKYLKDQKGKTEVQVTGTSLSDIKVSSPAVK